MGLALPRAAALFVPQSRAYSGQFTFALEELLEDQGRVSCVEPGPAVR